MTLKGVTKFNWKRTCGLQNDIKNLVIFHASSRKSENLHFDWILLSKAHAYLDETENEAKFEEKLILSSTNDMRKLVNFNASSGKSGYLPFDVLFYSIAYKVSPCKVQKNYLSWHWKKIQTLKKKWLFIWKMTWEIWWTLTWSVESLKICI